MGSTEWKIEEVLKRNDESYFSAKDRLRIIRYHLSHDKDFQLHGNKSSRFFPALIEYCRQEMKDQGQKNLLKNPLRELLISLPEADRAEFLKNIILSYQKEYKNSLNSKSMFFFSRMLFDCCPSTLHEDFFLSQIEFFKDEFIKGRIPSWLGFSFSREPDTERLDIGVDAGEVSAAAFMINFISLLSNGDDNNKQKQAYNSVMAFWKEAKRRHEISEKTEIDILFYAVMKLNDSLSYVSLKSFFKLNNDRLKLPEQGRERMMEKLNESSVMLECICEEALSKYGDVWNELSKLIIEEIELTYSWLSTDEKSEYVFRLLNVLGYLAEDVPEQRLLLLELIGEILFNTNDQSNSPYQRNKLNEKFNHITMQAVKGPDKILAAGRVHVFKIRPCNPGAPVCVIFNDSSGPQDATVKIWYTPNSSKQTQHSLKFLSENPIEIHGAYPARADYDEIKAFISQTYEHLTQG